MKTNKLLAVFQKIVTWRLSTECRSFLAFAAARRWWRHRQDTCNINIQSLYTVQSHIRSKTLASPYRWYCTSQTRLNLQMFRNLLFSHASIGMPTNWHSSQRHPLTIASKISVLLAGDLLETLNRKREYASHWLSLSTFRVQSLIPRLSQGVHYITIFQTCSRLNACMLEASTPYHNISEVRAAWKNNACGLYSIKSEL